MSSEEKRVCKDCGQEKPIENFYKIKSIAGKIYRQWRCNKCAYQKEKGKPPYAKTHREQWNEYQREYARINYYDYYKKRGFD